MIVTEQMVARYGPCREFPAFDIRKAIARPDYYLKKLNASKADAIWIMVYSGALDLKALGPELKEIDYEDYGARDTLNTRIGRGTKDVVLLSLMGLPWPQALKLMRKYLTTGS